MTLFNQGQKLQEQVLAAIALGFEECRRIERGRTGSSAEQAASRLLSVPALAFLATSSELCFSGDTCSFYNWALSPNEDYKVPPEAGATPDRFDPDWLCGQARDFYEMFKAQLTDPTLTLKIDKGSFDREGAEKGSDYHSGPWMLRIECPVPEDLRGEPIDFNEDVAGL